MKKELIPAALIARSIHFLRGQKVMLDFDLAALYGVTTKVLNQAVKRNAARFPDDFMFRLTLTESESLLFRSRSQFVTLKRGQNIKYRPYAFTEQGVAMLSSAWVAHASRVLVSASRRSDLPIGRRRALNDSQSPRWRDAIASTRDACATQRSQ